jgi:cell division topological specificity factor
MKLLRRFQRTGSPAIASTQGSAAAARERLQVLLSHERTAIGQSRLVEVLREEMLAVIAKHVSIKRDQVQIKMDRSATGSTVAIEIEIPTPSDRKLAA